MSWSVDGRINDDRFKALMIVSRTLTSCSRAQINDLVVMIDSGNLSTDYRVLIITLLALMMGTLTVSYSQLKIIRL